MDRLRGWLGIVCLVLTPAACFVDHGTSSASAAAGSTTASTGLVGSSTSGSSTVAASDETGEILTSTGETSSSPTTTTDTTSTTSTTSTGDDTTTTNPSPTCSLQSDCPASTDECIASECINGTCQLAAKQFGTFCNNLADQCDGQGNCRDCVDNGGCADCCICSDNLCTPI